HFPIIDPAELDLPLLILLSPVLSPLRGPPHPLREPAHEVPGPPALAGEPSLQGLQLPPLDEELDDVGVVARGVDVEALRHGGEVVEQVHVAAVVHEVRGHGDPLVHHVGDGEHGAVRVEPQQLLHDAPVRRLVPLLVGGDGAAGARQDVVPVRPGEARRVPVRHGRRALLEAGVHEPQVRVVLHSYHAGADEVLDGLLDHAHVDAAGEVHVLAEDVAVAVLLGGPGARPDGPGAGAGAGLVADAVERVDHGLVRRQRLLGNHVPDQHDEVLVGEPRGARAELVDLVLEHLRRRVRQEVRRLPALLHGLEQRQQRRPRPPFQRPEHLRLLRRHRVRHA
ncbi:Os01g0880850, partial [Oryza sativa Japonica Group]